MGRRGRQQSEGDPTDLEAGGTSRRAGGKLSKAEQRRADAEAAHAASATASSSSELPPGSDALSSDAAGSGTEPPCTHCGSAAHPSRACGARKDRAKATTAKCHLCGRRGHLRKDCPGLDDGGTGQSKYKGKYSKLPAVSAAAAAGAGLAADSSEDEGEAPWWPALSKDVQVADWCTRPARLLASLGQRAALSAFVEARPLRFPAQLGLWLMVFDEPATLLPEGASLEYRFWEQPVYALAETPGAALAFGLAPRYAAAHWASTTADRLREYLAQETAMAVGVTGLDFAAVPVGEPGRADRQAQVEAFLGQLKLAREMNKAVLAHVAGAEAEFTAALARELPPSWPIVLVGYRGSPDWLLKLLRERPGVYVAFDGSITFSKHQTLKTMAADTPPKRTLLASLSPDCRPKGRQFSTSEDFSHPGHLIATAMAVAAARNIKSAVDVLEDCAAAHEAIMSAIAALPADAE